MIIELLLEHYLSPSQTLTQQEPQTLLVIRRTLTALTHHSQPEQFVPLGDAVVHSFGGSVRAFVGGDNELDGECVRRALGVVGTVCAVRRGSRMSRKSSRALFKGSRDLNSHLFFIYREAVIDDRGARTRPPSQVLFPSSLLFLSHRTRNPRTRTRTRTPPTQHGLRPPRGRRSTAVAWRRTEDPCPVLGGPFPSAPWEVGVRGTFARDSGGERIGVGRMGGGGSDERV